MATINLDQLVGLLEQSLIDFNQNFAEEAGHRVVDKTPVDGGGLRGSVRINETVFGNRDPGGSITKQIISAQAKQLELVDYDIIAGAPYALQVEKGTANVAPAGFIARTANEAQDIANNAARKVK